VLSCRMLTLAWGRTFYLLGAVAVMALALNGLATGLGALYPNLKEDNPSKIVSGFGGTFCLVVSFLYIVASVVLVGLGSPWARAGVTSWPLVATAWTLFLGLSWLVGWVPLRLSMRRVSTFEY